MAAKTIQSISPSAFTESPEVRTKAKRFRTILMRWAKRHGRRFPWRRTSDPYKTLVAEMMLQRTRSEQVAPVYKQFLARYPAVGDLARANQDEVDGALRPLGLAFRSRTFVQLAKVVLENRAGCIPARAEEVVVLPGVGPYVASALDAFLTGRRLAVIDANVARVISRVFGIGRPDWRYARAHERREIFEVATACIGRVSPRAYHYALLDFAAKVCTAVRPACPDCPMHRAGICAHCKDAVRGRGASPG
jgi:A/G-specific adenine glycosylase